MTRTFYYTFFFLLILAGRHPALAQNNSSGDYYSSDRLHYDNFVYRKNIQSVMLHREGSELSTPVLELNSGEQLQLSFDDLEGGEVSYSYTFQHCTADWQASDLLPFDYMEGYTEDRIVNHIYSFNTIQNYTHYSLLFPDESIRLTKTGNYLLKVYSDYDPTKLVLTQRFMIFESKVTIVPNIHIATGADDRRSKQEVDFSILYSKYRIDNPFGDLKVVVLQNDRWDNAITGLKPVFLKDNELVYDHEDVNVFNGGNEFREFDFRSLKYITERVGTITFGTRDEESDSSVQKFYHVDLLPDQRRSSGRYYTSTHDLDGKYVISMEGGHNTDSEGDYAFVHFHLPFSEPITDGNLYIGGSLTGWTFNNKNKLQYNYDEKEYQCTLFLKQGYYNYEYFLIRDGSNTIDETFIEGSHSETENAYVIYVYNRPIGSRYDELIGARFMNTSLR